MDDLGRKELLSADETGAVVVEVEGQHSSFPISLKLSEQEHEDGNESGSDDKNSSTGQNRFKPATLNDCENLLLTTLNKNMKHAADRKVCLSWKLINKNDKSFFYKNTLASD